MQTKLLLLGLLFVLNTQLGWSEKHCPLCEKVRAYNEQHPENNFYWYDDYLKEQADKGKSPKTSASPNQAETSSPLF